MRKEAGREEEGTFPGVEKLKNRVIEFGLIPTQGVFGVIRKKGRWEAAKDKRICGLGIGLIGERSEEKEQYSAATNFGIELSWIWGYIDGWDSILPEWNWKIYLIGWERGKRDFDYLWETYEDGIKMKGLTCELD